MKRILSIVLSIVICLSFTQAVFANKPITVNVDGKQISFDTQPDIVNDRVMVPMRAIFESVGAEVDWDAENQVAVGYLNGLIIAFQIGNCQMIKNYITLEFDTAPMIINNRTYLPVRAVAEGLGFEVQWDGVNRAVNIFTSNSKHTEYVDEDGWYYSGEFDVDTMSGYVTIYTDLEEVYFIGKIENFEFVYGRLFYDDGAEYLGSFKNNYREYGTYTSSGGFTYEGSFDESGLQGDFIINGPSGNYYEAYFVDSIMQGTLITYFADGSYGEYTMVDDVMQGPFIRKYKQYGSYTDVTIEGNMENGVPKGIAVARDSNGEVITVGEFVDGKFEEYVAVEEYLDTYY